MSNPSEFLFKEWSDAARQFDYFVAGFIGALSAYFVQNLTTFDLGWNASTIEFSGVLCLLLSLFSALICIERHVTVARITYDLHTRQEYLTSLLQRHPQQPVLDPDTGRHYSESEIVKKTQTLTTTVAEGKKGRDKLVTQSRLAYDWRNRLMIAGLVVVILSKLLPQG